MTRQGCEAEQSCSLACARTCSSLRVVRQGSGTSREGSCRAGHPGRGSWTASCRALQACLPARCLSLSACGAAWRQQRCRTQAHRSRAPGRHPLCSHPRPGGPERFSTCPQRLSRSPLGREDVNISFASQECSCSVSVVAAPGEWPTVNVLHPPSILCSIDCRCLVAQLRAMWTAPAVRVSAVQACSPSGEALASPDTLEPLDDSQAARTAGAYGLNLSV